MNQRAASFDAGPLNWLWPELEQALAAALEALPAACAPTRDVAAAGTVRGHLHRVGGALRMVGLVAVAPYVDELEQCLARATDPDADAAASCAGLERAIRALVVFLQEVRSGAPLLALKLFPHYAALQRMRGVEAPNPADLFLPDLDAPVPPPVAAPSTAAPSPAPLAAQRRAFQAGLLAWLRGDPAAAGTMRDAIAAIDAMTADPEQHAFWWIAGVWLDALAAGGLPPDVGAKQLAGRIDAQIRRAQEGLAGVPERLRCEVLYQIAQCPLATPGVRAVREAFRLSEFIPSKGVATDVPDAEPALRAEALRVARAAITDAKDAWLACTTGIAAARTEVQRALATVRAQTDAAGDAALTRLVDAFANWLRGLPEATLPEAMALEGATCLLFIEAGLADDAAFAPDTAARVDTMAGRLGAVAANLPLAAAVPPPLPQPIFRQPRERALVARVASEIRVNLARIEAVLDAFFRDPAKHAELPSLGHAFGQARGALRLLGLDAAAALLDRCAATVERSIPGAPLDDAERAGLAETLSGVDLYLQVIEQQRPGAERVLSELHLIGEAVGAAPASVDAFAIEARVDRGSADRGTTALATRLDELASRIAALRVRLNGDELQKEENLEQSLLADIDAIARLAAALRASLASAQMRS